MHPPLAAIDERDTHRLIPAVSLDESSVLARVAEDDAHLKDIFDLDGATNDRLLAQDDRLPGINRDELVFGIPNYTVVNASFTHPCPGGGRFNGPDRGAWYAGFELETSRAEAGFHKERHYHEIGWNRPEDTRYQDILADFTAEFHDCREPEFAGVLNPDSYAASQQLAGSLLTIGSAGVVYPSVRGPGGTCLACFRPALVNNVRRGPYHLFCWRGPAADPFWRN